MALSSLVTNFLGKSSKFPEEYLWFILNLGRFARALRLRLFLAVLEAKKGRTWNKLDIPL